MNEFLLSRHDTLGLRQRDQKKRRGGEEWREKGKEKKHKCVRSLF